MAHLSYQKLVQAVHHEFVSTSEILEMSRELADAIEGLTVDEARGAISRTLMARAEDSDADLDVDKLLGHEVTTRMDIFDRFEHPHIAEAVWRAKSRRAVLDLAWELVVQGMLRPTRNSTEKFDLSARGEDQAELGDFRL